MRPALLFALSLLVLPQAALAQTAPAPAVVEEVPATEDDTPPGPPPPLPDLADPNGRAGSALNEPDERSGIPKSLRASGARSGGPANELNPSGRTEAPAPPKGELGNVLTGRALFHGNYCGKGNRGAGIAPIDALDTACMHHDTCYDTAGYSSCACDATLRREATAVSDDPAVPLETRRRALSVTQAAAAMECRQP
ncbi:phospholipase A2 family protein [Methylorubrum sp. SB2]|uniref:phospholipase A2 family protein n=1 Tax=Methylorubrum subtropicum TaxID=3138812 RepID=UPI00313A854A